MLFASLLLPTLRLEEINPIIAVLTGTHISSTTKSEKGVKTCERLNESLPTGNYSNTFVHQENLSVFKQELTVL